MPRLQKLPPIISNFFRTLFAVLLGLIVLTYPFLVYFGLYHFEPRVLYGIIGGVLIVRFLQRFRKLRSENILRVISPFLAVAVVIGMGLLTNSRIYMLFLPGLVTLAMASVFGYSLYDGPSMIEMFARMEIPDLTDRDVHYCWTVTVVWTLFFLANTLVVTGLALAVRADTILLGYDSLSVWTVYTGVVSYLLVGLLFGIEYLYRKWAFRRFHGSYIDRFLREIIPPRGDVIKTFVELRKLPVQGRRDRYPVAIDSEDNCRPWKDFITSVAGLKARLSETDADNWVLYGEDGYEFAIGLLGIWQAGGTAILPPNERNETVRSLCETAGGIISDQPDLIESDDAISPCDHSGGIEDLNLLDPEQSRLRLFTSGSSGDNKEIPKTLDHLQREIFVLEELWGQSMGDATIISTASHHHIYGLIYKILWPLSAGRTFVSPTVVYPERLVETIRNHEPVVLVTTPTHLERFVEHNAFSSLKSSVRMVLTSGGKLSTTTAERVESSLGIVPYEVLGSTETGGVAWRNIGTETGERWTPLPGVKLRTGEHETLQVQSPYVSVPDEGYHDMKDRINCHEDGTFELLGRADRVKNIAEKRVDLNELESRLEEHAFVTEAGAVVLETTGMENGRKRLGMAVVLEGAWEGHKTESADGWKDELRNHLLDYFPPVVVPRQFKRIDQLPRDSQGKVTVPQLRAIFSNGGSEES
jgi:uncharacterized membrane protein/acyl-CoA synthetase (AMP-forming)/AMP-acid ligase II